MHPQRLVLFFSSFAVIAIALVAGYSVLRERQRALDTAELTLSHLTRAQANQMELMITSIDLVLNAVSDELRTGRHPLNSEATHFLLKNAAAGVPQIYALVIGDQDGNLSNFSLAFPPNAATVADRSYFAYHRDNPGSGLRVGHVLQNRTNGRWVQDYTRALRDPEGRFLGVLLASVEPVILSRQFAEIMPHAEGTMALFHQDGTLLAGHPYNEGLLGSKLPNREAWFRELTAYPHRKWFRAQGIVDSQTRYYSYLLVRGTPLVVGASIPENSILAPWRETAQAWVAGAILSILTIIAGTLILIRQFDLRARVERELRQARDGLEIRVRERTAELRKLSRAVEQSPYMVFITNLDGIIEYVNPRFCELTGYAEDEAIGRTPRLLKSGDTPPEVYIDLWKTIRGGGEWRREIKDRRKDGRVFWAAVTITPVRDETGAITHFVATHEDITQRKLADAQVQSARDQAEIANRAKSEMLANMSHELRTPLNAIIGFSEVLLNGYLGPLGSAKHAEYLQDIQASGHHLLSLINDVLDVSAIEAGKLGLSDEAVDVGAVIVSAARLVESRAAQGRVAVKIRPPEPPISLRADERRLKQIVLNLLSNAVKFTPEGGTVGAEAHLTADGRVAIVVTDTGIGMTADEVRLAMDRFGQVDSGLNRKREGTGLGLPLTVGLIEAHGGRFELHSEKWKGTVATAYFPKERRLS